MVTLDPTKLTPENKDFEYHVSLLNELLCHSQSPLVPNRIYPFQLNGEEIQVELTHPILIRERASDPLQKRIEVLDPEKYSDGHFGIVFLSLGVLIPEKNYVFKAKPKEKQRLCKMVLLDRNDAKIINDEYKNIRKQKALHAKSFLSDEHAAYFVMRKVGDYDLYEILLRDHEKTEPLTIRNRLLLSCSVLNSYKRDFEDNNLLHRDIKPENIVINKQTLKATFIDYAYVCSLEESEKKYKIIGTVEYIAPEILLYAQYSKKSDLFALGLTLAMLWNDRSTAHIKRNISSDDLVTFHKNRKWLGLFSKMNLPEDLQTKITKIIDGLAHFDDNQRISLTEAIKSFEELANEYPLIEPITQPEVTEKNETNTKYHFFDNSTDTTVSESMRDLKL